MTNEDRLVLYMLDGAIRPADIPLPKTTRSRAMRELQAEGLMVREDGWWRLTGKGYEYARVALSAVPRHTDNTPPQLLPSEGISLKRKF